VDIEDLRMLLGDERPPMRGLGARLLAESASQDADGLLLTAVVDADESVGEHAVASLRARHPWLGLAAFAARSVPREILAEGPGADWVRLREAARDAVATTGPARACLERWLGLPGLLADIVELLDETGRTEDARHLRRIGDGWTDDAEQTSQILLSPTYRCNLDCEYCYAREWRRRYPPDMSREALSTALSWARSAGCNFVILCGGEPTQYRHFEALLVEAEARGLGVMLTSNAVYAPSLRPLIVARYVREFIAHYDQSLTGPDRAAHRAFTENVKSARDGGVEVFLRYTLTPASGPDEWAPLLSLAEELGIEQLNYGVASPSVEGGDAHFTSEELTDPAIVGALVTRLLEDTEARGIRLLLCKPVALCAFSPHALGQMIPRGVVRSACDAYRRGYSSNVTINPDLTTFPCSVLGVEGPRVTDFGSLAEVGRHNEEFLRGLLHVPLVPACEACFYWYRGLCQGACLVHQYRGHGTRGSEDG
jgi:MoaA/NifB/PqqE/SkfB family radical SAM enzyme